MALKKSYLAFLLVSLLTGCTMTHTSDAYLPSKDGITAGETITVQGNQNVYAIARKNNVSMREIIVLNNLQPPFALKPGQTLILPARAGDLAPTPYAAPSGSIEQSSLPPLDNSSIQSIDLPPPTPPVPSPPTETYTHTPSSPSASVDALSTPIAPPRPIPTTVAPTSSPTINSTPTALQPSPASPVTTPPPSAALPLSTPKVTAPDNSTDTTTPIDLIWPVQGPVLSGFGPKGEGLNNDGVNIGAPKGAPVVAAANGIVVYAGSEMKGFGNLILIRHEGGWVTAYAHLERTLVSKDAVVAQGDMIGTVGKTGNVSSPQLHFELRHKDKPIDPKTVIKE